MRPVVLIAVATFMMLADASSSRAQGVDTSTIAGTATDVTGAVVADVSITLESPALIGGPRRTSTTRSGEYRITGLTGGTYELVASLGGFKTVRHADIRLPGEQTLVVDVRLEIAGVGESVAVKAAPSLIDVTHAASPTILDRDLLDNLPTDRIVAKMMNLLPGVNVSAGLGGTQQSNPVYVDGVNTTDTQQQSPRSTFNYNWMQEIQVAALGANAEYGDFSGVVQTNTLRSGSNRRAGLGEYRTTRPSWISTNTSALAASVREGFTTSSQRIVSWYDANAQLGGPIVADRLWYFGGVQHFTNDVHPALVAGEDSVDERDDRMLAKITSAPRAALRLEGFYEFDRYHLTNDGLAPTVAPEATTTDTLPNHNWNARVTWVVGDRTTFEVRNSGLSGTYTYDPSPPGTRSGPSGHVDLASGVGSVNASTYSDWDVNRNVIAAVFNRFDDRLPGAHHDLKFGAEFERADSRWVTGFPGDRLYLDLNGAPYLVRLGSQSEQRSTIHRTAVYAQDAWAPAGNLTFQLGLRATFNRGIVYQGTVLSTDPVDPRIGLAWDASKSHKTVVRGHYGRYHDALLTAHFSALDAKPQPPLSTASVVGPDQFVELSRVTNNSYDIDPTIRSAYFDQFVVGVERELWPHWAVLAQVVRRNYKDLVGVLDTGSIYEPVLRQDPGPDGRLGSGDDGGLVTAYRNTNTAPPFFRISNPAGAYRRYSAMQLSARKQYASNWQMQASYVRASTRGNIDNSSRSNAGGPENGFNGIFANPNRAIYADGPTLFDFRHEVKVLTTWRLPIWGRVSISGVYQYHTGLAWARSAFLPGIQATYLVRMEPRGSRRTPALNQLDFRSEKTFGIGSGRQVGIFADVFNLTNQGIPDPGQLFAVEFRSGATFGQPLSWIAPRTLRAGLRLTF